VARGRGEASIPAGTNVELNNNVQGEPAGEGLRQRELQRNGYVIGGADQVSPATFREKTKLDRCGTPLERRPDQVG
jgi:hypothetical protein